MMKGLVCLFVVIVCVLPAFGAGFYSVHSPNGLDVWGVGNNGTLFHSFDGGVTWATTTQGSATLRSVYTMNSEVWVVGDSGVCYSSTDGGSSWSTQTLAGGTSLRAIAFSNPQTGWVAGGNGTILKSTDSGSSWSPQTSNTSLQLNSLVFVDAQTGYAGGASGTLLKTTNAGETWTTIAQPGWTKDILSVSASGQTLFAAGADGFCVKSTNGGGTWISLDFRTDTRVDVNDVFAVSPTTAYFVGGGGFIRSSVDGGASYDYGIHQMHAKLNDVFFYTTTNGWACSEKNNAILRTTDGGVTWQLPQGTTVNYQWLQKFSAGSIGNTFCVNALNKDVIYVAMSGSGTSSGTVYMSGNRGETWSQTATISYSGVTSGGSVWSFYVSPRDTNIWIAATSGAGKGVRRSTNRGVTWTTTLLRNFTSYGMPLEMDPDHPDTLIFAAEGTGSGPDGVLYFSKNFGASWDTLARTSFRSPCDIVIVPGNTNLWYVGDGVTGSGQAQMWRSTNYGRDWASIYSSSSSEIPMIAASRLRNTYAFATAWSSVSYTKSTNSGLSWTSIASTSSSWGTDIAKDDPNVVIYGTYGGSTSYLSTNAGASFITSPLSGSNSGMLAYDRATIIAHQAGGGVWKYNVTYTVPTSNAQVLTVISPNGGENWSYNSVRNITWSAGNIPNVKIDFRTSPGNPWQTIAASVQGSLGTYAWTVPNAPTTQARVRISDALDLSPVDSSNADFLITVASISATGPLTFGNVGVGQTRSDTIRITNSGTGPLVVTSVTTGTSRFAPGRTSFTIAPGSSDTLSVTFAPTAAQTYTDTLQINSNAVGGPLQVPLNGSGSFIASVSVLSPNGGEVWQVGSVHSIVWSSLLVADLNLYYKSVPGNNWLSIAANVPAASGSFAWTVPNAAGSALVRVVSSSDSTILDESNSPFVIQPPTSVVELGSIPTAYELAQNYPNPFNPTTQIVYGLPRDGHVTMTVYNALGQEIARLLDRNQPAGRYALQFAATDAKGVGLSTGIYYYSLQAGEFVDIKKMLLVK
jgi:photosystem II stability/assembly factor-like uncharacterized protein